MGVYEKSGVIVDFRGPKKWTNSWAKQGTHLREGARVDVRVKSVNLSNKKVFLELLDTGPPRPEGMVGTRTYDKREGGDFVYQ